MRQTDESVNNLPEQTIDALIEITHSKQLEQFKKEYRTPEGGVNVCYGIEAYGRRREMAGEIKGEITGAVRTYKDVGFSFANTVKRIMTMFKLDEKEAEKDGETVTVTKHAADIGPNPYYWTKFQSVKSKKIPKRMVNPSFNKLKELME